MPVTCLERLEAYVAAGNPQPFSGETFPCVVAPLVRLLAENSKKRDLQVDAFGLLPHEPKDATFARRTYNPCSETGLRLSP